MAEELSFTRAARRLHVVQSGVSSAIQGLERELGAGLFDRDQHRVALTDAGQALLPEARTTLAAAQAAVDAVGEAKGALRGTLTVGTMLSTGRVDLPALLGQFHGEHPGVLVRLRLAAGGSAELGREVASGRLDLALTALAGRPPAGLALRPLAEEPLALVCRPDHPLAASASVTLDRLAGEPFIDFPPGWGNRAVVDQAFAAAGLERQVLFEVADYASAAGLVWHGLGMAFLPASTTADLSGLVRLRLSPRPLLWRLRVATPSARRPSAAAQAFLAALLAAHPGLPPAGAPDGHHDMR